ncbi:MAG TPA: helix-turn-helix transcriptional regulator, partial [Gemmatimonas sp.]|uniref:helix-turn-helix transcriptional regulator n=1 Tax=Gemmatimonas sp. TaxID=1962908 RepID=UPI002EDB9E0E
LYVSTADGAPPVSEGVQLIFNPAGTTHRDRFAARDKVVDGRFLTISLDADVMNEAAAFSRLPEHAAVVQSAQAQSIGMRLSRACTRGGGDASLTRHALTLELLSHVSATDDAQHVAAPVWLRVACEQLDDSLGGNCSIADVARTAGVHPVHLARVFRQHMGMSPADYLRRRRLEQARSLLRCTVRSLSDIALTCGFNDQSHFSNAFRAAHGMTPSAFRVSHGHSPY